jgi:hypothetical protein
MARTVYRFAASSRNGPVFPREQQGARHLAPMNKSSSAYNSASGQAPQELRMPETWYRGESPKLAPSKPGGSLHDLGDGMYLTDSEQVAWKYAKSRADGEHKDYRVLQVSVDRKSLGRVLDLSKDPGWQKFMKQPMFPGHTHPSLQKSRLDYVKGQNELYGQFFREYLQANKLNINAYEPSSRPNTCAAATSLPSFTRTASRPSSPRAFAPCCARNRGPPVWRRANLPLPAPRPRPRPLRRAGLSLRSPKRRRWCGWAVSSPAWRCPLS